MWGKTWGQNIKGSALNTAGGSGREEITRQTSTGGSPDEKSRQLKNRGLPVSQTSYDRHNVDGTNGRSVGRSCPQTPSPGVGLTTSH